MRENEENRPLSQDAGPEATQPAAPENTANAEAVAEAHEELSEKEAEQRELEELEKTDGEDFAARYQSAKERDLIKLEKEMEDRSKIDTKKKKWKTALKVIFIVALIGVSIWLMFGLGDYIKVGDANVEPLSFIEMLHTTFSWRYFLVFIAAIVAYIVFESLKFAYLLKVSTGKWRMKNAFAVNFLGKYYDGITPLGTGGQPFQIYYLHKKKVPAGPATAVPLVKYIITTFVFGIMSAVFLGLAPGQFESESATAVTNALTLSARIIAWVGVSVHLLIPTVMILLSAFPKVGKKIIAWIVKVLAKMRIVKHKYAVTKKYVYEVAEYRNALKLFLHKWYQLIPMLLICAAEAFLHISLPFFAVLAIAGNAVPPSGELLFQIMCLSAVAYYSATLIPTPGNSGAAETTTSIVFATVAAISSVKGWVVFAWRFASFYLYIIVGVCMILFTTIRDAVRAKRNRKQQN